MVNRGLAVLQVVMEVELGMSVHEELWAQTHLHPLLAPPQKQL
jgi:hypothetical protein